MAGSDSEDLERHREEMKEVVNNFGDDTDAGRALRKLYCADIGRKYVAPRPNTRTKADHPMVQEWKEKQEKLQEFKDKKKSVVYPKKVRPMPTFGEYYVRTRPGKKTEAQIRREHPSELEMEPQAPPPGRQKFIHPDEKRRLQMIFTHGSDKLANGKKRDFDEDGVGKKAPQKEKVPEEMRLFEKIVAEIEEREQFLKDMEEAGLGDKYRNQIHREIQEV